MKVLLLSLGFLLIVSEAAEYAYERHVVCTHDKEASTLKIEKDATVILNKAEGIDGHSKIKGSLGIIGGMSKSIGDLYFVAMAALRVGVSDVIIFTTIDGEGNILQQYDTNLRVQKSLEMKKLQASNMKMLPSYLRTMDVIILGPGLQTNSVYSKNLIKHIVGYCKQQNIPLIVDLDSWFLTLDTLALFRNYPESGVIFLPNHEEFEKIYSVMKKPGSDDSKIVLDGKYGSNVYILRKACSDRGISINKEVSWVSSELSCPKRGTGQGHLLTGAVGAYYTWALEHVNDQGLGNMYKAAVATYAASAKIKICSNAAFNDEKKGMITSDILRKMIKFCVGDTS